MNRSRCLALLLFAAGPAAAALCPGPAPECTRALRSVSSLSSARTGTRARSERTTSFEVIEECRQPPEYIPVPIPIPGSDREYNEERKCKAAKGRTSL